MMMMMMMKKNKRKAMKSDGINLLISLGYRYYYDPAYYKGGYVKY